MKKYLFLFLIIIFISCNDNSTEPEKIETVSRNYKWSSDTLAMRQHKSFRQIWGNSSNDVWAVGDAGIWHYDGNTWKEIRYKINEDFECIYGSSNNDIWVFNDGYDNGTIIQHSDGNIWTDLGLFTFTETDGFLAIGDVDGSSSNEIYAVGVFAFSGGRKSVIMNYTGNEWSFLDSKGLKSNLFNICYDNSKNKYYIEGYEEKLDTIFGVPTYENGVKKIYEFDGENLEEIYSEDGIYKNAYSVNGEVYFMNESKIWTYSNNSFQLLYDFSEGSHVLYNLDGRSEKDMIIHSAERYSNTSSNYLIHYNGEDLKPIYQLHKIEEFLVFEKEIFVIGTDENENWISAHGVLQE